MNSENSRIFLSFCCIWVSLYLLCSRILDQYQILFVMPRKKEAKSEVKNEKARASRLRRNARKEDEEDDDKDLEGLFSEVSSVASSPYPSEPTSPQYDVEEISKTVKCFLFFNTDTLGTIELQKSVMEGTPTRFFSRNTKKLATFEANSSARELRAISSFNTNL